MNKSEVALFLGYKKIKFFEKMNTTAIFLLPPEKRLSLVMLALLNDGLSVRGCFKILISISERKMVIFKMFS